MMPPWFAEGISQYQAPNKQQDCWDAHRDMILRSAALEDRMLSYNEMGFFGKNGQRSEQVYDHGFGLVNYIAAQYGPEAIRTATHGLKTMHRLNMDGALKEATGKDGDELYDEWKASLQERYRTQVAKFDAGSRTGQLLKGGGYMTIAPVFSPNGHRIAFLSNKGSDYSGTALSIMNHDGSDVRRLQGGVTSPPCFSADGKRILYSKKHKIDKYGSMLNDLFVYDVERKKETQLTKSARTAEPEWSPDGSTIVAVENRDGTHRLVLLDAEGKNRREIFAGSMGTQVYNPHFSPDGERILFGIFAGRTRDIAMISVDGTGFEHVLGTGNDERDARWSADGKRIMFSSERSGIFNIYEMDLADGWIRQLSNVVGGAFMPHRSPHGGTLVYSGYSAEGYSIYKLDDPDDGADTIDRTAYAERTAGAFDECKDLRSAITANTVAALTASTPSATQEAFSPLPSEKYSGVHTPFQIYPRFLIYDGTPRFGLLATSYEILDKQSLLVAGSYGTNGEFDGFLSYEVRHLFPTLFADFFVVREKASDSAIDTEPTSPSFGRPFTFDLRYDLWQADIGVRLDFGPTFSLASQNQLSLYWSHGEYRVNIDGKEFDVDGSFRTSFDGGWKYYIGDQATLQYTFRSLMRKVDMDINPRNGRQVMFRVMRSFDDLFEDDDDFAYAFRPEFSQNHYNQYTLDWREYIGLPWFDHSLRVRMFGSVIDEKVDDFFWLYLGGLDGIRGYTYYSLGGRRGVIGSLSYRFPIIRNINRQFLHIYFRDIYGGVFAETANAWDEDEFKTTDYKTSAGYELRMSLGSYYIFPTTVSVTAAYSFDPVSFTDTSFGDIPITIEQEEDWSYYFSVGFGFDL
jgi:Tol biopolymer transport system component